MAEMGGNWPATWGEERERERVREADSKFESAPICGLSSWPEWRWAAIAGDAVEWSGVAPICGRSAWAEWRWAAVAGDAVEWSGVGADEAAT